MLFESDMIFQVKLPESLLQLLLESNRTPESIVYLVLNAPNRVGEESKRKKTLQEKKKLNEKGMREKK